MKMHPRISVSRDMWSSNPALPLNVVRIWLLPPDIASDLLPNITVIAIKITESARSTILRMLIRVTMPGVGGIIPADGDILWAS